MPWPHSSPHGWRRMQAQAPVNATALPMVRHPAKFTFFLDHDGKPAGKHRLGGKRRASAGDPRALGLGLYPH